MDLSTFIVSVFCLSEDWLRSRPPLRRRGPAPELSDAEVLTIEVVGEFLGIDTDKGIYEYFRRHYGEWFPTLKRVHRTTFTRQAANLWKAKEELWQHLLKDEFGDQGDLFVVDSLPMPACRKARSRRCKILSGLADRGWDQGSEDFFYGVRAHLLVAWPGVILRAALAPANVHDLELAERLLDDVGRGWVMADRNYWSPLLLAEQLRDLEGGPLLVAQYKMANQTEKGKGLVWPKWLLGKRKRIETLFSQLVGRYKMKKVWARDAWHLSSRFLRKVLSHTIASLLCRESGLSPLRFDDLLSD